MMSQKCNPVVCTIDKRIGTFEAMLHNKWLGEDPKVRTMCGAEIRFLLDLRELVKQLDNNNESKKGEP